MLQDQKQNIEQLVALLKSNPLKYAVSIYSLYNLKKPLVANGFIQEIEHKFGNFPKMLEQFNQDGNYELLVVPKMVNGSYAGSNGSRLNFKAYDKLPEFQIKMKPINPEAENQSDTSFSSPRPAQSQAHQAPAVPNPFAPMSGAGLGMPGLSAADVTYRTMDYSRVVQAYEQEAARARDLEARLKEAEKELMMHEVKKESNANTANLIEAGTRLLAPILEKAMSGGGPGLNAAPDTSTAKGKMIAYLQNTDEATANVFSGIAMRLNNNAFCDDLVKLFEIHKIQS